MGKSASGRMINQDIGLSTKVAHLSPEALALFCLLIPHFNSHGKMLANPYVIKGNVCPLVEWLTVEVIETCLAEISSRTNVKWWRDERGLFYLHSLNWKDHQTLREDRMGPDHLPNFPGGKEGTPGLFLDNSGSDPAKGKGREGKGRDEGDDESFNVFWSAYPRKAGRQKASGAWLKLAPDEELQAKILEALEQQKETAQWQSGVIPHASTWLNGKRWEDEVIQGGNGEVGKNLPDWMKS